MKLIQQNETGGPEVLHVVEAPLPEPGPGELRIRMAAAGVNRVDAFVRAGALPMLGAAPFRLGWDVAGEVEAVGPGVTGFAPGTRVMGLIRFPREAGAYAEAVIAPAAELAILPEALDDIAAGGLPLAGLTAWQALVEHGKIAPGERVLIHGGAGGVGHLAVQIAKALGAEVTATAGADELDWVREIGADHVFDYRKDAPAGPFDLILETIGGAHAEAGIDALAPAGRMVALRAPLPETFARAEAEGKTVTQISVHPDAAGLTALAGLASAGQLKVEIAATYPLAEAARAHAALEAGAGRGKIVLVP